MRRLDKLFLAGAAIVAFHAEPANGQAITNLFNPSWSPDGRLLFESDAGGKYGLWLAPLGGGSPARFLSADFEHQQAVVSPDGKRIAYVVNVASGDNDIFVANIDGTGAENVTRAPGSQYLPRWSLDSRQIAYVSGTPGQSTRDIFIADVVTKASRNLTSSPDASESNVGWAPGTDLVFTANRANVSELFAIKPDGTGLRQLTKGAQPGSPTWSRSGEVTFTSRHEGRSAIYRLDASGAMIRIGPDSIPMTNPAWSPDGQLLAFVSSANARTRLFVMNADGSGVRCVAGTC
jgi:TolB protein